MQLTPSIVLLVFANAVPLLGALLWGWQVFLVMTLFWLENIIIGLVNIVRIIFASGDTGKKRRLHRRLGSAVFFCFHFGFFALAHGVLVFKLFGEPLYPDIQFNFPTVLQMISQYQLYWALVALLMSHAVSLLLNYFLAGEYLAATVKDMMRRPYQRVVILHVTILVGGLLLQKINEPLAGMIILIIVKLVVDVYFHRKEHEAMASEDIITP